MLTSSPSSPFYCPCPGWAISIMLIACAAKESYLVGPKVGSIAGPPYFGICNGEAFPQPGQVLQQRLRLFFFHCAIAAPRPPRLPPSTPHPSLSALTSLPPCPSEQKSLRRNRGSTLRIPHPHMLQQKQIFR